MVEKLYFPDDVAARYRVSVRTAKKYMREMRCMQRPMAVRESDLLAYEHRQTVDPASEATAKRSNKKSAVWQAAPVITHIPRRKEMKRT